MRKVLKLEQVQSILSSHHTRPLHAESQWDRLSNPLFKLYVDAWNEISVSPQQVRMGLRLLAIVDANEGVDDETLLAMIRCARLGWEHDAPEPEPES